MRIAITGSSGLIGGALCRGLPAAGHEITRVVRRRANGPDGRSAFWNPAAGEVDAAALNGHDAVIHLAGANIAAGRWTERRKALITESRVGSTALLARTLAGLDRPPSVFLCASAIGYYGSRPPGELVDESAAAGAGFLARVCRDWEAAAAPAAEAGIRTVLMRIGVVLDGSGGALGRMIPIFRMGLGGRVGSGEQVMSWIALEEFPSAVAHILGHEELSGPVNLVAPGAVSNTEFTRALARVLSRPAFFPLPAFAARLAFGEMGEELLLAGVRVVPQKLLASGYKFVHPDLELALRTLL